MPALCDSIQAGISRRRWLIELVDGNLRLVDDEAGLRDLIARGLLTRESRVYEVGDGPHTSAEIPGLARLLADVEMAGRVTRTSFRSLERARLSEELAILNRPLEDEEPFYEELPRSRIRPLVAVFAIFALAGTAGYFQVRYRRISEMVARAAPSNREPAPVRLSPSAPAPISARAPDLSNMPQGPAPVSAPAAARDHPAPSGAQAPTPGAVAPAAPERAPEAAAPSTVASASRPTLNRSVTLFRQLIATADRLIENGRTRQAENLYRRALAEQPRAPEALTGLAYTCLDRGQATKSIALFKQALAGDRAFAPALFGLGEAYRDQGRVDLAVDAFRQYVSLKPSGRDSDAARRQIQQLASSTVTPPA
jgi:tetratricopeptide (TPR) repeat protein